MHSEHTGVLMGGFPSNHVRTEAEQCVEDAAISCVNGDGTVLKTILCHKKTLSRFYLFLAEIGESEYLIFYAIAASLFSVAMYHDCSMLEFKLKVRFEMQRLHRLQHCPTEIQSIPSIDWTSESKEVILKALEPYCSIVFNRLSTFVPDFVCSDFLLSTKHASTIGLSHSDEFILSLSQEEDALKFAPFDFISMEEFRKVPCLLAHKTYPSLLIVNSRQGEAKMLGMNVDRGFREISFAASDSEALGAMKNHSVVAWDYEGMEEEYGDETRMQHSKTCNTISQFRLQESQVHSTSTNGVNTMPECTSLLDADMLSWQKSPASNTGHCTVIIVALYPSAGAEIIKKIYASGADIVLPKPLAFSALMAAVERIKSMV